LEQQGHKNHYLERNGPENPESRLKNNFRT